MFIGKRWESLYVALQAEAGSYFHHTIVQTKSNILLCLCIFYVYEATTFLRT